MKAEKVPRGFVMKTCNQLVQLTLFIPYIFVWKLGEVDKVCEREIVLASIYALSILLKNIPKCVPISWFSGIVELIKL